ncbi:MAG: cytochrome c3 family protein [Kofleriaceae bacterium]
MQRSERLISIALAIALVMAAGWFGRFAYADDFFSTSPGPLSQSHAAQDNQNNCNDCHVDNTRVVSNDKCLNCHDHNDLRTRINAGKGFHASSGVRGKKCEACHNEHQGRGYDIMGWSSVKGREKGFDHDLTGWKLSGKHAATDCAECHKAKNKQGLKVYMGTDRLCGASGCHAQDQPHKLVKRDLLACERCHGESVWVPPKSVLEFNHNDRKDAGMPLIGQHKDIACTPKCHPKAVFDLPAQDADYCGNSGCHKSSHDGHLFGKRECEWCHSPTFKSFKQQYSRDMPFFDHSERTRFDLGAHKRLKCYDCHTKALGESKPIAACEQCHAKDNKHGERFKQFGSPPKCNVCHPTTAFKPTVFNHSTRTNFALKFKHAEATCRQCHRGKGPADFEVFTGKFDPNKECMSCHQHSKVHADPKSPNGKYKNSQCLQCHMHPGDPTIRTGKDNKMVDNVHGKLGSFPLEKEHAGVVCAACHTGRDKKNKTSFSGLKPNCDAAGQCHEDSLHEGTLGSDCLYCHSPGTWDALRFDHDKPFPKGHQGKVDEFPLKGAHKDNQCEDCHPRRDFAAAEPTCSAKGCHADDDAHKGRLGKACEKCHVETGDNIFNHNTMSVFRIDGGHLQVRCADCHPSVTFKPRPQTCFGCHPEPKVHKGQYGTGCEQCHTTRTWKDIKPMHDVGDFSLKGMHDNIACERCHRDSRPLAGSGNLCINCHRQDDIHSNGLSPRCGECHTQWSFAPARFDHSRVGCNLTGVHRTVACFDCHRNGNFGAIGPQCIQCHRDDALKRAARDPDPTAHELQPVCATCHNPSSWSATVQGMNIPFGRDSVCR